MKTSLKKPLLIIAFTLGVFLLYFIIIVSKIIFIGLDNKVGKADTIVVLGNEVGKNGQPVKRLAARLDKGAELFRDGYAKQILVTGGIDKNGFDEARVMKEYLKRQGVRGEKIITDRQGVNTFWSANNARNILSTDNSVIIVSQFYHLERARDIFSRCGFDTVYIASPKWYEFRDIYSLFREFFAVHQYAFKECGPFVLASEDENFNSALIGLEGGVVGLKTGGKLEIPAGALATTTLISLERLDEIRSGFNTHNMEPSGLVLLKPATITFPITDLSIIKEVEEGSVFYIVNADTGERKEAIFDVKNLFVTFKMFSL